MKCPKCGSDETKYETLVLMSETVYNYGGDIHTKNEEIVDAGIRASYTAQCLKCKYEDHVFKFAEDEDNIVVYNDLEIIKEEEFIEIINDENQKDNWPTSIVDSRWVQFVKGVISRG